MGEAKNIYFTCLKFSLICQSLVPTLQKKLHHRYQRQ